MKSHGNIHDPLSQQTCSANIPVANRLVQMVLNREQKTNSLSGVDVKVKIDGCNKT